MRPLLTVAEVGRILGRSPRWVASEIRAGRLASIDLDRRGDSRPIRGRKDYRIEPEALESFLDARRRSGGDSPAPPRPNRSKSTPDARKSIGGLWSADVAKDFAGGASSRRGNSE